VTRYALDHVSFGARNAAATGESFARLGFATTPVSTCSWDHGDGPMSSAAVCVVFASEYLDFVEIDHPEWLAHLDGSSVYRQGAAPSGVMLRGESREDLEARPGSYRIVRSLAGARPDRIEYQFCSAPDSGLPLGWIHDDAPGAMRSAAWTEHPNTATGIRRVHLRVPALDAIRVDFDAGALGIELHEAPTDDYLQRVARLLSVVDRPTLLSLEFEVRDLDAARRFLEAEQIAFDLQPDRLRVAPDAGFGVGIQLVGAEA
jgi:hypothetical protein